MLNNTLKSALLGAAAVLALSACGSDDEGSAADLSVSKPAAVSKSSPLDKPFMLKDAEPVDVPALLTSTGLADMLEYSSAEFDSKLGATVLTNVKPAGENEMMSIGRIEIYGLNDDAITTLTSGGSLAQMTDMFEKVRVFDLAADFPIPNEPTWNAEGEMTETAPGKGKFSIAAMEFDGLKLKSKTLAEGEMEAEGADIANKLKSMSFNGMAMKGLLVDMSGVQGGQAIGMTADDMRFGSYSNGKFGGFFAKGFGYNVTQTDESIEQAMSSMGGGAAMIMNSPLKNLIFPKNASGTIGEMTWDGFSVAGLLPYLESGETPPVSAKDLISVGGMEILDQTSMVNGKKAASVERTAISPIEFYHFMPKQIKMVSEGETMDFTAYVGDENPEISSVLKKNGFDKVESESSFVYTFDPKAKSITLRSESDADNLFGMNLNADVGNFDYDAMVAEDGDGEAAMMATTIKGLSLKLEDEKLVDTIFAVVGAANGTDPAQLRQQASGIVTLGAIQGGQISKRIPDYATAVSTFLNEGGTLEIKVAPAEPVTVGSLAAMGEQNPAGMLDTLNLTVKQSN
ncbi:hypothetical protein [Parvularcula sp. LCG005]|uniref:hypothetical protein n=1 Tax=Parvularcula sp. LCG005 TaxID=3078805 RepID=UPI002941E694|nr:hypothetical protein [Parvularcula sp. LCG005]WOI53098.1 hypothetical protein RUI03_13180 [Parvularcula sp. LCG005]